ncbi:anti-sigma factor [Paenibacillus mesophilus]|uniref:anti-sigma factor n=1 Tax=Paenibacillus mesophilus TaxID=2582849 RepID=UPI0013054767|nr:anti-sigma factor [Paenibacillus mesophilus]
MTMETRNGLPCEYLIDCLIGEATAAERKAFERHLPDCPSCSRQWKEMLEVWNSLPGAADSSDPPAGLKEEVMQSIFGVEKINSHVQRASTAEQDEPSPLRVPETVSAPSASPRPRRKYALGAAVAAILLAACIWFYSAHSDDSFVVNAIEQPLYVEQTYVLNASESSGADAQGTGWVVCQGNKKKLVLNTSGLAATSNDEAYQVWLIHEGKRQNAGTFWVDPKGNGVLVYDLPRRDAEFDTIGITLEPDSRGNQPRGKKVLGN